MITLGNFITHFLQFFFDENQYLSSLNKPESESLSSALTSEMEENDVKESLMASSLALTVL